MLYRARALCLLLPIGLAACQVVDFGPNASGTEASEDGMPNPDPQYNCDPGDLNACESGQKCTAIELLGVQNLYDCVDEVPTLEPFAACTPEPLSGADGCPAAHLCVASDEDQAMGICMPMCSEDGSCAGTCSPAPVIDVPLCGSACNPTAQDCPSVLECLSNGDVFGCRYPGMLDVGTQASPCDGVTLEGCSEGYRCVQSNLVNTCTGSHCCTSFCDLEATDPGCPSPHSCEAFETGTPTPGLEGLGICIVPA